MLKQIKYILLFLLLAATLKAAYPEKPITFIVHSKPGSAIDITTRQLTRIAAKYSGATLLVENKTGGSGIVAMRYVLDHPADGYLVQAVTKSFISTVLISQNGVSMDDFYFLACMVIDPEVLITNRNAPVRTLEQIMADAKQKKGRQKWLGPLVGGVDHLMAVKTWDKLGIRGEWIPFEGGSDALAALLGRHGTVYVGNPVDVIGRPDLQIAVVAAPQRLPEYPDVPTFVEKGYDIPHEVLWRGYALKQGTNPKASAYLTDIFQKVNSDSQWIEYVKNTAAQPVFIGHEAFTEMVNTNQQEALKYLRMAGILAEGNKEDLVRLIKIGLMLLVLFLVLVFAHYVFRREWLSGEIIISLILIFGAIFLYVVTLDFPQGKLSQTAGPAAMPRLWIYGLLIFSGWLIVRSLRQPQRTPETNGRKFLRSIGLVGLMVVYLTAMRWLGYYAATFIFLLAGMYLMEYRRHVIIWLTSAGFVALSYFIFWKILQVPLPVGILFN